MEFKKINNKFLFLICFLFLVFICIVSFQIYYNRLTISSNSSVINSVQESEFICNDSCKYQEAFSKSHYYESDCLSIENKALQDRCLIQMELFSLSRLAVKTGNVSYCLNLAPDNLRVICEDNFYYVMSVNNNDTILCNNIQKEDLKNECFN